MRPLCFLTLVTAGAIALAPAAPANDAARLPVRIGMPKSMLKDVTPDMVPVIAKPFATLVKSQTGYDGELVVVESADDLRRQLMQGDLQFGAFHGFEYAWLRVRQPEIQAAMLVSNPLPSLRTLVVVSTACSAKEFCDLRGKTVALATNTREHTRVFLERLCRATAEKDITVGKSPNTEDALDDVVDGVVGAAAVEAATLRTFQSRKPARFAKLRVLLQSDAFPSSVIVYRTGGIEPTMLTKFRDGMTSAHKSSGGSKLLSLFKLGGFENVPATYETHLQETAKAYPPPDEFCR